MLKDSGEEGLEVTLYLSSYFDDYFNYYLSTRLYIVTVLEGSFGYSTQKDQRQTNV